jgi:hypothetical protein
MALIQRDVMGHTLWTPVLKRWLINWQLNYCINYSCNVVVWYLDLRGIRWRENGGSCIMSNFITCTPPQILLGRSSQGEWGGQGMRHAWERRENCSRFWWESPKQRDRSEDQGVGGIRMDLREIVLGVWIGFEWLRIGTSGGLLWVRWWTFGFLCQGVTLLIS